MTEAAISRVFMRTVPSIVASIVPNIVASVLASVLAIGIALVAPAGASDYPSAPVRIIVPYAAGGGADVITRTLTDIIATDWKATFIIENKPGGGTAIGTQAVASAPADGYTLLATSTSFLVSPMLMDTKPYVWDRDFSGVSLFAISLQLLVVNPSVPAKTLPEFTAWAKAQGDKAAYASYGVGSANHLGFEVLKRELGIPTVHVPYRGNAPAMIDLVSGHVQTMLTDMQSIPEQVQAGKVRAIAVFNESRVPSMPDLPTAHESGVKGYTAKPWFGALMRKGTPPEILAKWSAAFAMALKQPSVQQRLTSLGITPVGSSPQEMDAFLADTARSAEEAVKLTGAKME